MLMMPCNKLFTINCMWVTLCKLAIENHTYIYSYICGPCKLELYKKMGLHISLYVPSNVVGNYSNCNLLVLFLIWSSLN